MMAHPLLQPLIESLQKQVPMLVRRAPPSGDYLESVLSGQDLPRCCELLTTALGAPVKEFGKQAAALDGTLQWAVKSVGGVRIEQCLYLKQSEGQEIVYAALWPWASDAARVTLKIGISGR